MGWRAGWDGGLSRVEGRVWCWGGEGGGKGGGRPAGWRGMDLWSKECSGLNIVMKNIQPPT